MAAVNSVYAVRSQRLDLVQYLVIYNLFVLSPSPIIPALCWTLSEVPDKHISEAASLILEAIIGIERGTFWILTTRPSLWSRNGCCQRLTLISPRHERECVEGVDMSSVSSAWAAERFPAGRVRYVCVYSLSRSRRSLHSYAYLRHHSARRTWRRFIRRLHILTEQRFSIYYPLHYTYSTVP
jgi:hypothetical protein